MRLYSTFSGVAERIRQKEADTEFNNIFAGKLSVLEDNVREFELGAVGQIDRAVFVRHFRKVEFLHKALANSIEDGKKRLVKEIARLEGFIEKQVGGESELAAEIRGVLRTMSPSERIAAITAGVKEGDRHMLVAVAGVPNLLLNVNQTERAIIDKLVIDSAAGEQSAELTSVEQIGGLVIRILEDAHREVERWLKQSEAKANEIKNLEKAYG